MLESELPSHQQLAPTAPSIKWAGKKSVIEGTKRSDRKGPCIIPVIRKGTQSRNADSLGTNKSGYHSRFGWPGSRDWVKAIGHSPELLWEPGADIGGWKDA